MKTRLWAQLWEMKLLNNESSAAYKMLVIEFLKR